MDSLKISCDAKCQRDKNLVLLKSEMDRTKGTPEYDTARVKYYTLLEGQGWLSKEKEKIAKQDLDSKIKNYTSKYETLKHEQNTQTKYSSLVTAFKDQQTENEGINSKIAKTSDQTAVLNRVSQLSPIPAGFSFVTYLPILMDILIGFFSLAVLYMVYYKFIAPAAPVVEQMAGRRFSRRV